MANQDELVVTSPPAMEIYFGYEIYVSETNILTWKHTPA
jgi:hypothetical protein